MLFRFLSREEATYFLNEVHGRVCGAYQAGLKLVDHIEKLGYNWATMVQDAIKFAKTC